MFGQVQRISFGDMLVQHCNRRLPKDIRVPSIFQHKIMSNNLSPCWVGTKNPLKELGAPKGSSNSLYNKFPSSIDHGLEKSNVPKRHVNLAELRPRTLLVLRLQSAGQKNVPLVIEVTLSLFPRGHYFAFPPLDGATYFSLDMDRQRSFPLLTISRNWVQS